MLVDDAPSAQGLTGPEVADGLYALLCRRRGWTPEYLNWIEEPSQDVLKDLDRLIEALEDARATGRRVTIAPDFDMDGIASGVLGYAGLRELGFTVSLHLPDYRRGHDLTPADIDEIAARFPDTRALLTCDGGVNSPEGIAAARSRGWATWVTDHHQELAPGCPADITVNPCRIGETYANRGICGAHVLYQVIRAYTLRYQPHKQWTLSLLRLFAGLGTVADVMPLLGENRQLVRDSVSLARLLYAPAPVGEDGEPDPAGIDVAQSTLIPLLRTGVYDPGFVSAFEGFALLLKAFAERGTLRDADGISEGFYGFFIAPAMNSPRRTGAPLADCFDVFTDPDPDRTLAAAHRILANNDLRKQQVTVHLEKIAATNQPLAPWVYVSDAPAGMLGLLASQLMHEVGAPVVVVNPPQTPGGPVSGSARAPEWFDILTALDGRDGIRPVGHRQACGIHLDQPPRLDELVRILHDASALAAANVDTTAGADLRFGPAADCDAPLTDLEPIVGLVRRIGRLGPFGHQHAEPSFELVLDPAQCRVARIGSDGQHLRVATTDGLVLLWWNAADSEYDRLTALTTTPGHATANGRYLRFIAHLQLNSFRGQERLQAVITAAAGQ